MRKAAVVYQEKAVAVSTLCVGEQEVCSLWVEDTGTVATRSEGELKRAGE